MTVKELIKALSKYPAEMRVQAWDPVAEEYGDIEDVESDQDGSSIFIVATVQ